MKQIAIVATAFLTTFVNPALSYNGGFDRRDPLFDIEYVGGDPEFPVLGRAELPDWLAPLSTDDERLERFTGVWRGQWEGTLDTYLVLTEAEGQRVKVFYSWGVDSTTQEPGHCMIWGTILNDVLILPGTDSSISLTAMEGGTLFGVLYRSDVTNPSRVLFSKSP